MGRHARILDRDALADDVLAEWFGERSCEMLRESRRTVRIDPHTGRVQVTVALRHPGGRRCVLRVSRLPDPQ